MLGKITKLLTITLLTLLSTVSLRAADTQYSASVCNGGNYLFGCQVITPADGSGTYTKDEGGKTVYLHLLFGDPKTVSYEATIEPGQNYLFGCSVLTPTADTEETDVLTSVSGCDSTVVLKLAVKKAAEPIAVEYDATIEPGQTYLFGCGTYTTAQDITEVFKRANGADSTVTVHLAVKAAEPIAVEYDATIEPGQTYLFGCGTYTTAQDITEVFKRANGADSTVTVHLAVKKACEDITVASETTIEPGQNYLFGCQVLNYADEGDYSETMTLERVGGCDSIINLTVHVKNACPATPVVGDTLAYVCEADLPFVWHGRVITNDTTMCDDTLRNVTAKGCDSIARLQVNVIRPTMIPDETHYVCDFDVAYEWRGHYYDKAGDYYDTVPSTYNNKCADEIYTLHLRQYTTQEVTVDTTVCKGTVFEWKDLDGNLIKTFTESVTNEEYSLQYKAGCDSIHFTLNLTVLDVVADITEDVYICYGDTYEWMDGDRKIAELGETGVYHDTLHYTGGCDSARFTLNLTVGPEPTHQTMSDTTIYYGYEFRWRGQDYVIKADTTFRATDYDDVHTDCPATFYTRNVLVKPVEVAHRDVVDTVCAGATFTGRVSSITVDKDTAWTDSVRVMVDEVPTDSFYHYNVYVYSDIKTLPESLLDSVKAVCGHALDTKVAEAEIRDYLSSDYAHQQHFDPQAAIRWYVQKDGQWVAPETVTLKGTDSLVTFQCVVTDLCEQAITLTRTIVVDDPEMEIIENILVKKYGEWLLMLHVNNLTKSEQEQGYNLEFTEEDVDWYQIINGVETKLDHHGYYYTTDQELEGDFYAVINATNASGCNAVIRSNTQTCKPQNAPLQLIPNNGQEGTIMQLVNLNPDNDYRIYGYNEAGKLIQTKSVSGQAVTEIRAEGMQGIYMLRVVTGDKVETLRYIIK